MKRQWNCTFRVLCLFKTENLQFHTYSIDKQEARTGLYSSQIYMPNYTIKKSLNRGVTSYPLPQCIGKNYNFFLLPKNYWDIANFVICRSTFIGFYRCFYGRGFCIFHTSFLAVFIEIISGPGIICGPIWRSFVVRGSFAGLYRLHSLSLSVNYLFVTLRVWVRVLLHASAGESNEKGEWTLRDDYLTKHAFKLTYSIKIWRAGPATRLTFRYDRWQTWKGNTIYINSRMRRLMLHIYWIKKKRMLYSISYSQKYRRRKYKQTEVTFMTWKLCGLLVISFGHGNRMRLAQRVDSRIQTLYNGPHDYPRKKKFTPPRSNSPIWKTLAWAMSNNYHTVVSQKTENCQFKNLIG